VPIAAKPTALRRPSSLFGVEERIGLEVFEDGHQFWGREAFGYWKRWL
jgi:hypothetical protein